MELAFYTSVIILHTGIAGLKSVLMMALASACIASMQKPNYQQKMLQDYWTVSWKVEGSDA